MSKAYHTDVERLAEKLDKMCQAAVGFGIHLSHVSEAAEMLRHLSNMVRGTEIERDAARGLVAPTSKARSKDG